MAVTPEYLLTGLHGLEHLNGSVVVDGDQAWIDCADGGKIYIRKTTEVIQLYLNATGCQVGKKCSSFIVSKELNVLCSFGYIKILT